jgi:hypothetical protein
MTNKKVFGIFLSEISEVTKYVRDRTDRLSGGEIATFMRTDIPAKRKFNIECQTLEVENIVYEVTLDKVKWLIFALYRPPSMPKKFYC